MILKWNKQFDYPKTVRSSVDGVRKYSIGQEKLPSVTTIISSTQDADKTANLAKWKAKVGNIEAERIKNNWFIAPAMESNGRKGLVIGLEF